MQGYTARFFSNLKPYPISPIAQLIMQNVKSDDSCSSEIKYQDIVKNERARVFLKGKVIMREQTVTTDSGLDFLPQAKKKLQSETVKWVRYLFG